MLSYWMDIFVTYCMWICQWVILIENSWTSIILIKVALGKFLQGFNIKICDGTNLQTLLGFEEFWACVTVACCLSPCRRSACAFWGSSLDHGQKVPVRKNSIAPQVTPPHLAMTPRGGAAAAPGGVLVTAKWCKGCPPWRASTQQGPLRDNINPFWMQLSQDQTRSFS